MASTCGNCGSPLGTSERFCASCGVAVITDSTTKYRDSPSQMALTETPGAVTNAPPVQVTKDRTGIAPIASTGVPSRASQAGGGGIAPPSSPPSMVMNNSQTVNVNTNIAILQRKTGPNLLVRLLLFICLGWWLGGLAILLSYLLFLPIITIPAGIGIINRLPQIMTLRPRNTAFRMTQSGETLIIEESTLPQRPWWQRILFVVLVGWWFGAIWLSVAWLFGILAFVTFGLTIPIAFWMFDRAGAVTSLYRT